MNSPVMIRKKNVQIITTFLGKYKDSNKKKNFVLFSLMGRIYSTCRIRYLFCYIATYKHTKSVDRRK